MTAAELLKPRYEIIASYPGLNNSGFALGDILVPTKEGSDLFRKVNSRTYKIIDTPSDYPHIFRKMNWWENRTVDQMPKKLKSTFSDEIYEITTWNMTMMVGYTDEKNRTGCFLTFYKPEFTYTPVD